VAEDHGILAFEVHKIWNRARRAGRLPLVRREYRVRMIRLNKQAIEATWADSMATDALIQMA
jgi:hypothetical protein